MRSLDKHKSASVPHNQFRSMQIREEGHLVMSRMVIFSKQCTLSTSLCCGQCVFCHCMWEREGDSIFNQPNIWGRQLGDIWAFFVESVGFRICNVPPIDHHIPYDTNVSNELTGWKFGIRKDKIIFYPKVLNHSVNTNLACVQRRGSVENYRKLKFAQTIRKCLKPPEGK